MLSILDRRAVFKAIYLTCQRKPAGYPHHLMFLENNKFLKKYGATHRLTKAGRAFMRACIADGIISPHEKFCAIMATDLE